VLQVPLGPRPSRLGGCLVALLVLALVAALGTLDYLAYMDRFPHAHWWSWLASMGGTS